MSMFLSQVLSLLTEPAGSLTYHLVLAFSIAWAFQAALALPRFAESRPARRLAFGLGVLLLLRVVLFIAALLGSQGLINTSAVLPLLDRAVTLLGLVVIVWLWAFPTAARSADTAVLLLGLLTLTAAVLGIIWWQQQGVSSPFNPTAVASGAEIYALVLLALGILLLAARRQAGWLLGLPALILLVLGHAGQLWLLDLQGDYPGVVRLAQIPAYALLALLPQRILLYRAELGEAEIEAAPAAETTAGDWAAAALLSLSETEDEEARSRALARALAHLLPADRAILIRTRGGQPAFPVAAAYDRVSGQSLNITSLDASQIPKISAAAEDGRSLRLNPLNADPDLLGIARLLDVSPTFGLLVVPVPPSAGLDLLAGLFLAPEGRGEWSVEDEDRAARLLAALLRLPPGAAQSVPAPAENDGTREQLLLAQQQINRLQEENERLIAQLGTLSQAADSDRSQIESLSAMLAVQAELQQQMERLQAENEALKRSVEAASAQSTEEGGLEGELRLALQEVALLRSALAQADARLEALRNGSPNPAGPGYDFIASIVQELRQPLSSLAGYTDFLLGGSLGPLGGMQRKFMERIKVATERLDRLADDLDRLMLLEHDGRLPQKPGVVAAALVEAAAASTAEQYKDRRLRLQVELPEDLPTLATDPEAVTLALSHLLQNAGDATPEEGKVVLEVRLQEEEETRELVLQVTDQGGGVPQADLERIFTRSPGAESPPITGLGDRGAGLLIAKTLVEALGGRMQASSKPGKGTTFSLLLPVAPVVDEPDSRRDAAV